MDIVRIARHARAHRGVITQTYLDTIGVNSSRAGHEVRAGRWRRLHEGVFTAAATPDSWELRAEAALAALPAGVLGLRAAARVHHLDLADTTLDVVVPHGGRHRLDGVTVHQSSVPEWHVVRRNGWRVTTLERTLVDLGKVVPANTLQRCIEDQIVDRRTTMARVESVFGELAGRGRPGIARTRSVLGRLDPEPPTESELEAQFIRLLERHGVDRPRRQASFDWLQAGRGRVDFWYPERRLIVELDGRRFHLRVAAFEADRRRDLVGLTHGIETVRITHRQLATESAFIVASLRQLLSTEPNSRLTRVDDHG